MNSRVALVEDQLRAAATRWKWLQFWRLTARFGIGACVAFVFLGALMTRGIIANKHVAIMGFILLSVFAGVAWLVLALNLVASDSERAWLARELEKENPDLFDRVNTLVHLEHDSAAETNSFFTPIATQAQTAIHSHRPKAPFSSVNAWTNLLALALVTVMTGWFFNHYDPWGRLTTAAVAKEEAEKPVEEEPLELAFPTNTVAEMEKPWAEVRITEPGYDITISKTSSVPVQIEAAANSPLSGLEWRSALNAGNEDVHELPPPDEPLFAAYSRVINAAELRLEDWDVLTYFARAKTDNGKHESEIYFIEVQPPPEELDALREGSSDCYNLLNELTGLIREQQQLIRRTRRQANDPAADPAESSRLADDEERMTVAIEHFTAHLKAAVDERLITDVLAELKQARLSTDSAAVLLREQAAADGEQLERAAMAQLSAARQLFQKVILRNPEQFRDKDPLDPNLATQLAKMAEFNDEMKTAAEFVKEKKKQQDSLSERLARNTSSTTRKKMADEEKRLREQLRDFQEKHPGAFIECQNQSAAAAQAMGNAESALRGGSSSNARNRSQQAGESLEKLENAIRNAAAGQQLADAHQLKEMLDEQIQQMGEAAKPGAGGMSPGQLQQLTGDAGKTLEQMRQAAGGAGTNAFSDELRQALSPEKMEGMKTQLDRAAKTPDDPQRRDAANKAREGMQQVSDAFEQSLPSPLQIARSKDPLGRGQSDKGRPGMKQLSDMLRQMNEQNRPLTQQERNQLRSALDQMRRGQSEKGAGNVQSQMVALLMDEIDEGKPVDALRVRQLIEQLKRYNTELPGKEQPDPKKTAELRNIDPGKFPPAYRKRIQEYFRKLSEGK